MVGINSSSGADKDHTALGCTEGWKGMLDNGNDREEIDVKGSKMSISIKRKRESAIKFEWIPYTIDIVSFPPYFFQSSTVVLETGPKGSSTLFISEAIGC